MPRGTGTASRGEDSIPSLTEDETYDEPTAEDGGVEANLVAAAAELVDFDRQREAS